MFRSKPTRNGVQVKGKPVCKCKTCYNSHKTQCKEEYTRWVKTHNPSHYKCNVKNGWEICVYIERNIKNLKKKIDNTLVSFRHVHNNKCMQSWKETRRIH